MRRACVMPGAVLTSGPLDVPPMQIGLLHAVLHAVLHAHPQHAAPPSSTYAPPAIQLPKLT